MRIISIIIALMIVAGSVSAKPKSCFWCSVTYNRGCYGINNSSADLSGVLKNWSNPSAAGITDYDPTAKTNDTKFL